MGTTQFWFYQTYIYQRFFDKIKHVVSEQIFNMLFLRLFPQTLSIWIQVNDLTWYGLVTPYDNKDLGQHNSV